MEFGTPGDDMLQSRHGNQQPKDQPLSFLPVNGSLDDDPDIRSADQVDLKEPQLESSQP